MNTTSFILLLLLVVASSEGTIVRTVNVGAALQKGGATEGRISALAVFAHFNDEADLVGRDIPSFALDLFDERVPGSVTHFYREMSRGQFHIDGRVLPTWYSARSPASAYIQPAGSFTDMAREIIQEVDGDIDLGRYDNDGPDGLPNSGDDDGYVDFLFLVVRSTPPGFIIGEATGIARLGLGSDYRSNDVSLSGGNIRIRADGSSRGAGGSVQQGRNFDEAVGSMAHEFGHYLGLPDLYDTSALQQSIEPEDESAGIGYWGIMGHGNRGWNERGGPNPFSSWSLAQLGWLGLGNDQLTVVERDLEGILFDDVNEGGSVYMLSESVGQRYYLVEFRRRRASYYERNLPAEGLLIWRINPLVAGNENERNSLVELVCADGQYADAGFPLGHVVDPFSGRDNLDFWSADVAYREAFGGNLGDAGDVWDGIRYTDFWAASNPAAAPGIAVTNIRPVGDQMVADVRVADHRRAGPVVLNQTWSDRIEVVGDLEVTPGVRLEVASGTRIEVGRDALATGDDPERVEFVVYGQLVSNATGRDSVLFTSAATQPTPGDWSGLIMGASARGFIRRTRIEYAETALRATGLFLQAAESARGVQVLTLDEVDILNASIDGIRLDDIEESLRLNGIGIRQVGGVGLAISGPGLVRINGAVLERNAGGGLQREGGYLELTQSVFIDNGLGVEGGANVRLGRGVFGQMENNRLSGGLGLDCYQCKEVVVSDNVFENFNTGLQLVSSRPRIFSNRFTGGQLAMHISGSVVPIRLDLNIVQDSQELLVSEAGPEVVAINNWWGSGDEASIERGMRGQVRWKPFLNFDPRAPLDFALG